MTRSIGLAVGAVLTFLGILFTLQGIGVVEGSAMSGETAWAVIGPLVALAGLALLVVSLRRRPPV